MLKEVKVKAGAGKFKVEMSAKFTGDGISVLLTGGEKPHIGAVVLSVPRPSLAGASRTSCNSWVIPVLGHKDDEIAKPVAEKLSFAAGQVVAVAAGIHVDAAEPDDIKKIVDNCLHATAQLIDEIKKQE